MEKASENGLFCGVVFAEKEPSVKKLNTFVLKNLLNLLTKLFSCSIFAP